MMRDFGTERRHDAVIGARPRRSVALCALLAGCIEVPVPAIPDDTSGRPDVALDVPSTPDAGEDPTDDALNDAEDVDRGDPPVTNPPPPTAAEVAAEVFVPHCGSHHLDGTNPPWLGAPAAELAAFLGAPSVQAPELRWVVPFDPTRSYLLAKVEGRHLEVGGAGARMPLDGSALPDEDVELLRRWIAAGAPTEASR
ncbi:MAG: hypothetical protein H6700_00750 [Myxococcales bacterium]|nr:hypothetical protein [Myxococcales bacterium]